MLLGAAAPAGLGFVLAGPIGQGLCLTWLVAVALAMHGLSCRASSAPADVLTVDERGILDRRLMSRPLAWQQIETLCAVDVDCAQVVDIRLRWPQETLAGTRWRIRVGAWCQTGYGVPAVSISMLLLDGSVGELIAAVGRYRPDLLHPSNRGAGPPSG